VGKLNPSGKEADEGLARLTCRLFHLGVVERGLGDPCSQVRDTAHRAYSHAAMS
jgi:hypothetical protein